MTTMYWIIFVIFTSYIVTVHSQTWVGAYNLDTSCSTASCCCLSNQIVITRPTTDTIAFNTSLSGALCMGFMTYDGEGEYPSGYSISISISIVTMTITLSEDSNSLAITSTLGAACSTNGARVAGSSSTTTNPASTTSMATTTAGNNTASANQNVNLALLAGFVSLNMIMRN